MANSTAGMPFGTAVGAVLFGLANLFAQHPQAVAIGHSLYTITEIAPYVFPDYITTAAKIKSFASYPQVSDRNPASSNFFQALTSEIFAQTPTVLITESSVIPPIQTSTTPDDIISVDSLTNGTSAESEPATVSTETTALEGEVQESSDERIENITPDFPHQISTIFGGTTVENQSATSSAAGTALKSEVPAASNERIDNEERVETLSSVNAPVPSVELDTENTNTGYIPRAIAWITNKIPTPHSISTTIPKPLPPINVPLPSDNAHATQGTTFDNTGPFFPRLVEWLNANAPSFVPVAYALLFIPGIYGFIIHGSTNQRRYFARSALVLTVACLAYYTSWNQLETLRRAAKTCTTVLDQQLRTILNTILHLAALIPSWNWWKQTAYTLVMAAEIWSVIEVVLGWLMYGYACFQDFWYPSYEPTHRIRFRVEDNTRNGIFNYTALHPRLYGTFVLPEVPTPTRCILAIGFGQELLLVLPFFCWGLLVILSSSIRKCFPIVLIVQLCLLVWFWIGRERCMGFVQRTTRATKQTAAAGWQVVKDYKKRPELLVFSLAASVVLVAKCGPHVVAILRPYFTVEMLREVSSQIKSMAKFALAWCVEGDNRVMTMFKYAFAMCIEGFNNVMSMAKFVFAWCSEQWHSLESTFKEALASYSEEWYIVKSWASACAEKSKSNYMDHWRSVGIHFGRTWHLCKDAAIVATQSATTNLEPWGTEYIPPFVSTCRPQGFWLYQGNMSILFSVTFVGFFLFCRQSSHFVRAIIALFWVLSFGLPGVCTERIRDFYLTVFGASFLASLFLVDCRKSWEMLKAWRTSAATRISYMWNRFREALRTGWQHCLTVWRSCRRASCTFKVFVQSFIPTLGRTSWILMHTVLDFISLRILAVGRKFRDWFRDRMISASETCKNYWRSLTRKFREALGIDPECNTSEWAFFMGILGEALGVEPYPVDNTVEEPKQKPVKETEKKPARETGPEPVRETEQEPVQTPRQASFADEKLPETVSVPTSSKNDGLRRPVIPVDRREEPVPLTVEQQNTIREEKEVQARRDAAWAAYEEEAKQRARREEENEKKEQEDPKAVAHKSFEDYADRCYKEASEAVRIAREEEEMAEKMAKETKRFIAERAETEKRIAQLEKAEAEAAEKLAASLKTEAQMAAAKAGIEGRTIFGHQLTDLNIDDFPLPNLYNRKNVARSETGVSSKAAWQDRLLGGPSVLTKIKRDQEAAQDDSSSDPPAPPTADTSGNSSGSSAPPATAPGTMEDSSNYPPAPPVAAQDTVNNSSNGRLAPLTAAQDAIEQGSEPHIGEMEDVQKSLFRLPDNDRDIDMEEEVSNKEEVSSKKDEAPCYPDEVVMGCTTQSQDEPVTPVQPPSTEAPQTQAPQMQDTQTQDPRAQDPQTQDYQIQDPQFQDPQVQALQNQAPQIQAPQNQAADDDTIVQDAFPLREEFVHDSDDADDEDFYTETDTAPAEHQAAPAAPANLPPLPDTPATKPFEYDSDEYQEWQSALYIDNGEAATKPPPAITVTKPVTKRCEPIVHDSEDEDDDCKKANSKMPTQPATATPTPSVSITKLATGSRPGQPFEQSESSEDYFEKPVDRKNTKASSNPAATKFTAAKPTAVKSATAKPTAAKPTFLASLLAEVKGVEPTASESPPTKPAAANPPRAKITLAEYTASRPTTSKPAASKRPPTQSLDSFPLIPSAAQPATTQTVVRRPAPTKLASRPPPTKTAFQPLQCTYSMNSFSGDEDKDFQHPKSASTQPVTKAAPTKASSVDTARAPIGEDCDSELSDHDDEVIQQHETEEAMRRGEETARVGKAKWLEMDYDEI
jgi:hypothetical protein